jgi:hypothetical protein
MSLLRAALNISRDVQKQREASRLLEQAKARKAAEEEQAKADAAQRAKNAAAPPLIPKPGAAPLTAYGLPKIVAPLPPPPPKIVLPPPPKPMIKEEAVKAMAPGQVGGMIGAASKEIGSKVVTTDQGAAKNIPSNNNTMFGNIAVKEGGAPSPYAKMAVPAPAGAPPSQYGVAKPPTGPPAAPGTYGTAKPPTAPPPPGAYGAAKSADGPPPGAYGPAKLAAEQAAKVAAEQAAKVAAQAADGPKPMIKEDAIKAMAPGQIGGMIGGAGKDMGGKVEMIGQGLAPKDIGAPTSKIAETKSQLPEAIAKKVEPEVKKIVDSFGKPESSQVEQRKMEAMKEMGVPPPKDAKDMEDLRKGIYRPEGKEIPGTGIIDSLVKDLQAFGSMIGKLAGGKSGYTSGELFGSSNFMILVALVVAIILASRR